MRTGVFFCQGEERKGINIDSVAKYSANLPDVETVQILKTSPPPDIGYLAG